jgi:hypothetical protein
VSQINKLKIFNDPIYGFITIPNALIYDLIQHPYFQRLRRISNGIVLSGLSGANHTRFHHALGCMHLMQKQLLYCVKGVAISVEEVRSILLFAARYCMGLSRTLWKKVLLKMYITRKSPCCLCIRILNLMDSWICRFKSLKGLSSSIYVATHF